ncbi:MSHA biogenesis protein MshI [Vibrio sp. NTOU-M3]|uniref:MSHA biogenesis protein MshI n=1 Tax=Vibrio sp. NTOU-M3 TaxID=3234954 RepID=UPI00349FBE2B
MKMHSILGKFKKQNDSAECVNAIIQPSAIYLTTPSNALPQHTPLKGQPWVEVLLSILQTSAKKGSQVNLVLHSGLYQTYQIEKPNLPNDELQVALPFLLKDLISEKVTEIIADASVLPGSNKLQAYVISKSVILELHRKLAGVDLRLGKVLVEEEVWAHSVDEPNDFLLLQRSKESGYKVSAYVAGSCAFQRHIRGITPPLTGVASSVLQLDGIALELQRSIDYLSSQLRGTSIHQMKICCDEEEQQELANALAERLSVKVSALSERNDESGLVLSRCVTRIESEEINLYPEYLKPKKDYFSLPFIVACWAGIAVLLLAVFGLFQFQQAKLERELHVQRAQETEFTQQLTSLNQRLARHKPSPEKVAAVARLKLEIQSKQDSMTAMGEYDESQQVGYSGVMRSLAQLGRDDIALRQIRMDAHSLDLQGVAREPKAIPNWVRQFKQELNLIGRTFEKLKIGRNEKEIITFELTAKDGGQP